jgi:cupin fold WbuC family metalloprotein
MLKIFSRVNPNQLIAVFLFFSNKISSRVDLVDKNQPLQFSVIPLRRDTKVRPHKHLKLDRTSDQTQEVWIVIKGKLKVQIFDVNGECLHSANMRRGDVVQYISGGHSISSKTNNSIIFEVKNGPYFGPELDREYLE